MGVQQRSSINLDYFTEQTYSGGSGGNPFNFVKEDGAVLKKIETWQHDTMIRGVKVTMTDRTSFLAGSKSGSYSRFELQAGETITRLNIQRSGDGTRPRLGAIWLKTSKNRDWGVFSRWLSGNTQHWVEVGSGLCCGIFGCDGSDVDSLGMAMLRDIKEATMEDVAYPNLDLRVVSSNPTFIKKQTFDNRTGSTTQSGSLELTEKVTKVKTWSTTNSIEIGAEYTVKAGIPKVAEVEATSSWTVSSASTQESSTEESTTITYKWPVNVPIGKKLVAEGRVWQDEIECEFEATMKVKLMNGKLFSYRIEGEYDGANYSRSEVVYTEES